MLTEFELKRRLGLILGMEEHGDRADWSTISSFCDELLEELPSSAPQVVKAYLTDCHIRRVSRSFANGQRSALIRYLRSSEAGDGSCRQ